MGNALASIESMKPALVIIRIATLFMIMSEMACAHPTLDFFEFDQKARNGASLSVVFLGGSLTWGAQATNPQETSYRALIGKRLEASYPKTRFQFWDAAIGGTGSQLAAFRLERDVLSRRPDLVFLDFTINDNPYPEPDAGRLAAYESLVHRLVQAGIPVVQVILPAKRDVEADPPERPLDVKHKEIASDYGLPMADAVALAKKRVAEGKVTPDQLWDLPEDRTHPGDAGYALYAEAVWDAFQQAISGNKRCHIPKRMRYAETYLNINRYRLAPSDLPGGWHMGKPHRNAVAYDFVCSRWMDELAVATKGADVLRLKVRAEAVMIFGEQTKKSGSYLVSIDKGEAKIYSAACAEGNMRLVQVIAEGLDPEREHEIEISPILKSDEELRIESVCLAGSSAFIESQ